MSRQGQKYMFLVNWIRNKINEKKLKPGDKLYSENELGEMFGMSRQTVRHAIGVLENEGLVERIQGSGTYISGGRNMPRKRTKNIMIISTYVDGYIFPVTLQSMVQSLSAAGYRAEIMFTNNRVDNERMILESILERDHVDGVIVEAAKGALLNPNLRYYKELRERQVAFLFFNCRYPELAAPLVALDDVKVAEKAVRYLLEHGHRKIGGIFKMDDGQGRLRYGGYARALLDAGIKPDDQNVVWINTDEQKNLKNIKDRILNGVSGCTSVFCYNDEVAFDLIKILKKEGIRIPEDLSVVSIDGSELSLLSKPKITSIPYPMEELGKKAAENIVHLIDEPDFNGDYFYCPEILVRESVCTLS